MPVGGLLADPASIEEAGYGLGEPDGILVLTYRAASALDFGGTRQDFLHQLYYSPDAVMIVSYGDRVEFVGAGEAFWAQRTVSHEVHAAAGQTVYRVCLREVPPQLAQVHAAMVSIDAEAGRMLREIARPGQPQSIGMSARPRILAGIDASTEAFVAHHSTGRGIALRIARELSHYPASPRSIEQWAALHHTSVKTVQRDFVDEFGTSFSRWRTQMRLRAARVLLQLHPVEVVARKVGYASASSFVVAFTQEHGHTPGSLRRARQLPCEPVR